MNFANQVFAFRVFIVLLLTTADGLIAWWIWRRFSWKAAIVFFLNPVSLIIVGYHNQFDNLAILVMLMASIFFNVQERFGWRDLCFVFLFSVSLTTKHLFFMLPLWLIFRDDLRFGKRLFYSIVPVLLFLIPFVPYALANDEAARGILKHVFLYRSCPNFPLLHPVLKVFHLPQALYTVVFLLLLAISGVAFRKTEFKQGVLLYTICLVAFTSAMANQYLVIPMAALSVFGFLYRNIRWPAIGYAILTMSFLLVHWSGLDLITRSGHTLDGIGLRSWILFGFGYSLPAGLLVLILVAMRKMKIKGANVL